MSKFRVGDKVRAFGVEGVVYSVEGSGVIVDFPNDADGVHFYADGRFESWHKEPSLVLVERAKPKWLTAYALPGECGSRWLHWNSGGANAVLLIDSRPVGALIEDLHATMDTVWRLDPEYESEVRSRLAEVEALLRVKP